VLLAAQVLTPAAEAEFIDITADEEFDAPPQPIRPPANTETGPPAAAPRTKEDISKLSREELFRSAFGKAAPDRPQSLLMRLFVEGRALGNTEVVYSEDFSSFNFTSQSFSKWLDRIILPEERAAAGDSAGFFNSALLESLGYGLTADDSRYELLITVPPDIKSLQRRNLGGGYINVREPKGREVKPAAVSFYANYDVEERLSYSFYDYRNSYTGRLRQRDVEQRRPVVADFDGALNVYRWVLESSAEVREPDSGLTFTKDNITRGDTRIVRDFVPLRSRLTLGEIGLGWEILSGEGIVGARYEHNDWLFGNDPRAGGASVTFFMPKSGEVEVYMDGKYNQRFYLPAGHHQISGFGGEVGRNRVQLVLRMEDGGVEEIPFEFVLGDPRNMLRGDMRYAVTAGVRRGTLYQPTYYGYRFDEPAAGAEVMYGLLHTVSVGAAAQGSQYGGLAGLQALWYMGIVGWTDWRAYANTGGRQTGYRGELSYTADLSWLTAAMNRRRLPDDAPLSVSFSARGHYQNDMYNPSAVLSGLRLQKNTEAGGVSGNLSFGFFKGSVSANGGVTFYRDTGYAEDDIKNYYPIGYNYGLRISQSVYRVSISAGAGENVSGGMHRPYFTINSNYALGIGKNIRNHRFSATGNAGIGTTYIPPVYRKINDPEDGEPEYELVEPERFISDWNGYANAGWRWSNGVSGSGAHSYAANVLLRDKFQSPGGDASFSQYHNRAHLTGSYVLTENYYPDYRRENHNARLRMTGSLMFADGLWALGRQTAGNYVLVDTRYNLKDAKVHMNRTRHNMHDFSSSGWLGAAYQNRMMDYNLTEMTLTLTDVPPGAVMEENRYHVYGTYKQGYALRLGSKEQVIIQVRFTDNGEPLKYAYMTIEPEDELGGAQEKRATFTGGDGVLQAGGLKAGVTYRVKFSSSTYFKDALIEVPEGAGSIVELPDVPVEREE